MQQGFNYTKCLISTILKWILHLDRNYAYKGLNYDVI